MGIYTRDTAYLYSKYTHSMPKTEDPYQYVLVDVTQMHNASNNKTQGMYLAIIWMLFTFTNWWAVTPFPSVAMLHAHNASFAMQLKSLKAWKWNHGTHFIVISRLHTMQ